MKTRRIKGVFRRHFYVFLHSPPAWFDLLFWPIMDLFLWGLLTSFIIREGVNVPIPVGFLLGGVLLWDLMFRSNIGVATSFLDDTSWTHNILNLLVSPLRSSEYIGGLVAFSFSKVLAGWVVMLVLAWAIFAFAFLEVGVVIAMFAICLMLFGVALSMVVVGLALRFGPGADILAWGLVVFMLPLSAVYYPVEVLPGWLQKVALGLPGAHVFESMRTVLAGGAAPWGRLGIALSLDVVYLAAAFAFAGAMFGTMRRKGYVTRYM